MAPTNTEIIEKVWKLFHQYGIKSITMDDVSHELSISKKTLYELFSDKWNLVNQVVDRGIENQRRLITEAKKDSPNAIHEVFSVFKVYLQMVKGRFPSFEYDLKKYYPDIAARLNKIKRKEIIENTLSNLERGKNEGLYRENLNAEIISRFNFLIVDNLGKQDLFTMEEIYLEDFSTQMFLYHLYGILNLKGIKYLNENLDQLKITQ